ncbi:MFS transporter [Flavobacteriales bacterium]|nr:MFS transporter [Flavobacteriales bacterium]
MSNAHKAAGNTRRIDKTPEQVKKAWTMYDWANSVYSLVITTAIFPIFFNALTSERNEAGEIINDTVIFWGRELINTQLYSYVLGASFLFVIIASPLLSGMADVTGRKLQMMKIFCYSGALGCISLYFFNPEHLEWSMAALFLANIGFWGSLGFYNAFLPEIAPREEHDKLSAKGFAMGYVGSVLLLLVCLALIMGVGSFMTPWAFVLVAVWWITWSQTTFRTLPSNHLNHKITRDLFGRGFRELRQVARDMAGRKDMIRFLWAFFILSMALQTIMLMASSFGIKEVNLKDNELIVAIIAVQLLSIPGAFFVSWVSSKIGNIKTLMGCIVIWAGVCVYTYGLVNDVNGFYVAAGIIGFMMGGTQSLNRSSYSKMLPETKDHASYFSFYEVLEKGGLIIGMFSWGYIEGFTGSMRSSVLALIVFFAISLIFLNLIPKNQPMLEA